MTEQYLIDPHQTELTTTITAQDGPRVSFAATIIYPGGGGQPLDDATVTQDGTEYQVLMAKRTGATITYTLNQTLASNQPVVQRISGTARARNMRYHTLLHLIAGLAANECGCVVTSNQILPDHARIELQFPSHDAKAAFNLAAFQATVTIAITAAHPVTARIIARDAIADESSEVRTIVSLIPEDVTSIRLVKIADVDEEACAGTHVDNTAQIGKTQLTSKSKGPLKIRIKAELEAQ